MTCGTVLLSGELPVDRNAEVMTEPTPAQESPFPEINGFRVLQELGRSPKGVTYKARRLVEQDVVAVKAFRSRLCDKEFIARLPANSEATFFLDHKNIARCLGCLVENNQVLLISEYAAGESLASALKRKATLPLAQSLRTILQCATTLRYSGQHDLFHGRLHPADVIVGEEDARIVGVGIGERPEHTAWSCDDPYFFEPLIYTAPEVMPDRKFPQDKTARAQSDVYALGAIAFHLLAGVPPFKGIDEGALDAERNRLVVPVLWRPEVKARLPGEIVMLITQMMAPQAGDRPTYGEIIVVLNEALVAAEVAALHVSNTTPGVSSSDQLREDLPTKYAPLQQRPPFSSPHRPILEDYDAPATQSIVSRMYTIFLIALTGTVFLAAFVLGAKLFIYDPLQRSAARNAAPAALETPTAAPPTAIMPEPVKAAAVPELSKQARTGAEELAASTRQLEVVQDMLKKAEISHSPNLLRIVKGIAEKAGRDTPTGIKAALLAQEIEDGLLAQIRSSSQPVATPVAVIPAVGSTGTALPEPVKVPEPDPAAVAAQQQAQMQKARRESAQTIAALQKKARLFQYAELTTELASLKETAGDPLRRHLDRYAGLLRQEEEILKRTRARLKDQIERSPRRHSPLQVFPRKNDPNGDDIVDFDDNGLKILATRGPNPGVRIQAWEKVPPVQAFALLQLLSEKGSVDDQLALAALAFSRGLKEEWELALRTARALPEGADRAGAQNEIIGELSKLVNSLKAVDE